VAVEPKVSSSGMTANWIDGYFLPEKNQATLQQYVEKGLTRSGKI
jgi:hypothetical protein